MLTKAAKNEVVEHYSGVFKANPSVVFVEYKGLKVKELQELRSNLKDADSELKVVKNTLLKIAAKDTKIEQITDLLSGPTAIAICENDPAAVAKVFVKSVKDHPLLKIKGGVVEGNVVGADEITALSKLPSRPEMISQLLGILSSPVANFLGTLTQMQTRLLYALEAVKDTKSETSETKEESKAESQEETKTEAKDESNVEAKEEAKAQDEEESKAESQVESKVEAKEETKAQGEEESQAEGQDEVKEESEVEAKEGNEEETKDES